MKKLAIFIFFLLLTGLMAQKVSEVRKENLPKGIDTYIRNNFRDGTFFKAVKQDHKGIITYDVAIDRHGKKEILVFDKDGRYLKKGDVLPGSLNKSTSKSTPKQVTVTEQASPAKGEKCDIQPEKQN